MKNKVLFAHDGPMLQDIKSKKNYSVHYTDELLNRYSYFGKSISFLMRSKKVDDKKKYSEITYKDFSLIEVPNYKSIRDYRNKTRAKRIIKQAVEEHDVVIARLPSAIGTIAYLHAKKLGKPVLIELVACVFDALWNYDWRGRILAPVKMYQYKNIIRNAPHVIYVTDFFLQKRYPNKKENIGCSDVIINSNDNEIFNARLLKINKRKKEQPLILGTVAAIDVPYKGQADVIKAVRILVDRGIEIEYNIVGQGDPSKLQSLINELELNNNVKIIGALAFEDVINFLDNVDLYIQPSRQEGLPRAVVEAMSRACAVIGTKIAGIPELIDERYMYKPGNIKALSKLIEKFSIDRTELINSSKENYENSKKFYSKELDQKRLKFYNKFLNDNSITV